VRTNPAHLNLDGNDQETSEEPTGRGGYWDARMELDIWQNPDE
jgi:hypothetical protein